MIYEINRSNWRANLKSVHKMIATARFPIVISGAGISAASGLPMNFDKIRKTSIHKLFEYKFWRNCPTEFFEDYWMILDWWRRAIPNPAHDAIARARFTVITQNVDELHRDAGTSHLIELHGNLSRLFCNDCHTTFPASFAQPTIPLCPRCSTILRPGYVFVGEPVRHFAWAVDEVGRADLLLVVGTELDAAPLRSLPHLAHQNTANVIWVNERSETIIPQLFQTLLE
ncbi:Sir2 family NAD-dependent protein deacetylase [Alicyclobacillus sp. SP_1]|jgi:NAD-dependent deacetylase|uniref:Sir2 family NAD-dependent protein deacetylase n=1 Tax=Alicyclobacillus sp. SP_1 TaxID=2942475 RepID=UPI002805BF83|nr:Sir2 family NAD-dependent protein deacetylase [Alicyclobacillus sp. SP_1]